LGDTDEHGLPGYSKLEKNQISVEICENLCPNLIKMGAMRPAVETTMLNTRITQFINHPALAG
jgi:hypothetical protein